MLQYVVVGLVVGSIYAIAATSLVATYRASGILNFGFGGIAYGIARMYFWLNTQHGWPSWVAGFVCVVVVSPLFGAFLYFALFRFVVKASTLIKVITTLGVGVTVPPLCLLIFGDQGFVRAPGLAPLPVPSYKVFGVAITLDQIIVVGCLVAIVAVGFVILRFTRAGLIVRATVDSPALTSLNGSSPGQVAVSVWAAMTAVAGLAGILLAPIVSLQAGSYEVLVAGAFTAVLISKLSRVGQAIVVSLLLGLASSLAQYWLPPSSSLTAGIISAMPFAFILIFLLWQARTGYVAEPTATSGQLDRAIAPTGEEGGTGNAAVALRLHYRYAEKGRRVLNARSYGAVATIVIVALLPLFLSGFWTGQVAVGLCYGIVFLSYTLLTGEGGMIWLCQVSFAGIGAAMTAYFAVHHGVPLLAAVLLAALIVAPGGLIVGMLTARLGALYIALATLALGVLIDSVVLTLPVFTGTADTGVVIHVRGVLGHARGLMYVVLGLYCVIALLIEHYRRSSAGMAMMALRFSEPGARSVGINVTVMKVGIATAGAFIAAFGGGLLAISQSAAVPASYGAIGGLVWVAVLVTVGVRSNVAAMVAGMSFAVIPAVFQTYVPVSLANIPPALFGLGAIMLARNPDGAVAMNVRQVRGLIVRATSRRTPGHPSPDDTAPEDREDALAVGKAAP